jgi:hypothetical protein
MTTDIALASGLCAAGGVFVPQASGRLRIDDTGLDVLPGIIDVHGDAFERALAPRPGVTLPIGIALAELESQLLAAGITTAFLAVTLSWEPGLRSAATYKLLRDALRARAADAVPDLRLHVRFEAHNLEALDMLLADIAGGHVHMLSFNDHTPGILHKLSDPLQAAKFVDRAGESLEVFSAAAMTAGQASAADIELAQRRLAEAAREAGIPMASHDDATAADRAYFRISDERGSGAQRNCRGRTDGDGSAKRGAWRIASGLAWRRGAGTAWSMQRALLGLSLSVAAAGGVPDCPQRQRRFRGRAGTGHSQCRDRRAAYRSRLLESWPARGFPAGRTCRTAAFNRNGYRRADCLSGAGRARSRGGKIKASKRPRRSSVADSEALTCVCRVFQLIDKCDGVIFERDAAAVLVR